MMSWLLFILMNFHVFLAQDNLLSLQGKTGIVGDDEYASWEFRTMVSFILMSCQVTGKSLI